MSNKNTDWYRDIFTLDMINMSWTQRTKDEIDFIYEELKPIGHERVLDLACGFGRHSLELARRGLSVMGIDLSMELVEYARDQARQKGLVIDFIQGDLRACSLGGEFDVVLNLFDGAIGYFETEEENRKTFEVIAQALKSGGKHIMHIPNIEYVRRNFPRREWREGNNLVELLDLNWDESTRLMTETTYIIRQNEVFRELVPTRIHQRLYELEELKSILASQGMNILHVCGEFDVEATVIDDYHYICILSSKI